MQTDLNNFHYNVQIDGVFDLETDYAVRDFQKRVRILVDGIAGPVTKAKLKSTPARTPYLYDPFVAAEDPVAQNYFLKVVNQAYKPSLTNNLIYIDQSKYIVCIYSGSNHNWTLVRSFPCSIGKPETPTIHGTFRIKSKGLYFITKDNILCKYYAVFAGGFKMHSILYHLDGTVADGRLGYSISMGCVRMAIENAKFIYDNMPINTMVWIP